MVQSFAFRRTVKYLRRWHAAFVIRTILTSTGVVTCLPMTVTPSGHSSCLGTHRHACTTLPSAGITAGACPGTSAAGRAPATTPTPYPRSTKSAAALPPASSFIAIDCSRMNIMTAFSFSTGHSATFGFTHSNPPMPPTRHSLNCSSRQSAPTASHQVTSRLG